MTCTGIQLARPRITRDAFEYMLKNGITSYSTNRWKPAKQMNCTRQEEDPVYHITAYRLLEPENQPNLKLAVALIGPISVSIKSTANFFFYKSGVFYDPSCNGGIQSTNHAVLLVGYGTDEIAGDFWIIQNSWGTRWGEKGFGRITRNSYLDCGFGLASVYPTL